MDPIEKLIKLTADFEKEETKILNQLFDMKPSYANYKKMKAKISKLKAGRETDLQDRKARLFETIDLFNLLG